jgi:hypothetical protein
MDSVIHWIREILELGEHYLDLVILLACSAFGMLLTVALEWWFLPTVTAPDAVRRQKGYTFLFCWAMSAASSSFLWYAIDPADPLKVRLSVSIVVGAFGFFAYPPLARVLTDKFPAIGSAWDGLRRGK